MKSYSFAAKSYYLLTKPGIILGNLITTTGGFALASKNGFNFLLFFVTMLGLGLLIGSSCVINNIIDRVADQKMDRTKNRALARGEISVQMAFLFAAILGTAGSCVLFLYTNLLTLCVALFGFFVYVILYSFSKYQTSHGTLIGSIAGAVPPVVGYCAVSNCLDMGAWILFGIIVMWQMPHFFAIAMYRINDYRKAGIPVHPIEKGMQQTKIQILLYLIGFIAVSSLLFFYGYMGYFYLLTILALGGIWLGMGIQGLRCSNDVRWARNMFRFSLLVVTAQFIMIPLSI